MAFMVELKETYFFDKGGTEFLSNSVASSQS